MAERPYIDAPLEGLLARVENGHFESHEWNDLQTELCVHRGASEVFACRLARHLKTMQAPINGPRLAVLLNAFSVLELKRARGRLTLVEACLQVAELIPEGEDSCLRFCISTLLNQSAKLAGSLIFDELVLIGNRGMTSTRRLAVLEALEKILHEPTLTAAEVHGAVKEVRSWIEPVMSRYAKLGGHYRDDDDRWLVIKGVVVLALLEPAGFIDWWANSKRLLPKDVRVLIESNLRAAVQAQPLCAERIYQGGNLEKVIAVLQVGISPS